VELVELGVLQEKLAQMVQRAEDLVGSAVQFLRVKVHEVDNWAFAHHVEPTKVCARGFEELVGFDDVPEAFAHFSAFVILG
jgi:hypothetical protein